MWRLSHFPSQRLHLNLITTSSNLKRQNFRSFCPRAASKIQPERPTLDDVQRLSEGRAARTRGYGSRQIPHRLNADERQEYNRAKERGFLTLKGSGYRAERKGAPLANIWRQFNDANGRPCIVIEQQGPLDTVLLDLSPLRLLNNSLSSVEEALGQVAKELGVETFPPGSHGSPFTVIVPVDSFLEDEEGVESAAPSEGSSAGGGDIEDGRELTAAEEHTLTAPIWQQKPKLLFFRCERPVAKLLGKNLAAATGGGSMNF
ncbi:hypothetical protein Ndes2526B_g00147 [Nannochloris sp. 'desiccata']